MRPKFRVVLALAVPVCLALVGCSDSTPSSRPDRLVLDPGAGPDLLLDPLGLDSVWVVEDTLHLAVTYGGGCKQHEFRAYAPVVLDDPPRLAVYVRHDAMDDACRALVSGRLAFDVSPAYELLREETGGDGWLTLDVTVPGDVVPVLLHTGLRLPVHPDEEAESAALYLSEELVAPGDLVEEVAHDLGRIRTTYGMTLLGSGRTLQDIRFRPPWIVSQLVVGMDAAAFAAVEAGTYHAWDAWNAALGLEEMRLLASIRFLVLSFAPRLHPCRLVDLYSGLDLPGVLHLGSDLVAGDAANIFPRMTSEGITYLFYEGWGDCPAGCIDKEYWYAVPEPGGGFVLEGPYDPATEVIPPLWWSEAELNLGLFGASPCPWEPSAP